MKERIRKIMDYAQLTQQEFASRLGISPSSLSNIFTGRTSPNQKQVNAIHHVFPEININWLMFGEGNMMVCSDNSESINEAILEQDGSALKKDTVSLHSPLSLFDSDSQKNLSSNKGMLHSPSSRDNDALYGQNNYAAQSTKQVEKRVRKIKEIRVFFDDGTYESFVPTNK